MVLHTAELLAKGCVKAKHFHGSGKTEQLHGKVSSSSHFSVNSIKSPPPLKLSLLEYDNVKAFCNPQRRKYSLCEHTELESVFSVCKDPLLPKTQSLDKPNFSEMWKKNFLTCDKELQRDQSTDRKPGLPGRFEIKPGFLKPKNICNTVKNHMYSTDVHFSNKTG